MRQQTTKPKKENFSSRLAARSLLLLSFLILWISTTFSSPISAMTNNIFCAPYLGVEIGTKYLPFKKGYGDNLTRSWYPTVNLFLGFKLNDYFGLETGIETTTKQKRSVLLLGRDNYFGNILDPLNPSLFYNFTTSTQFAAYYANLTSFYPLFDNRLLELFASIGASNSKIKISHQITEAASLTLSTPITRTLVQRKTLLRVTVGLQSLFCDGWGVRGSIGFENTAVFKNLKPNENANSSIRASLQNSVAFRVGVFYQF